MRGAVKLDDEVHFLLTEISLLRDIRPEVGRQPEKLDLDVVKDVIRLKEAPVQRLKNA
jgi:hypothetical protein